MLTIVFGTRFYSFGGIRPSTPIASNSLPNPIILNFPDIREAPVTSNTQTKSNNFYVADGGQAYQILLENPTINVNVIAPPVVAPPENCPACPTINVTSTENEMATTSEFQTTKKKVVTTIAPHVTT
uniref:Uncharacterized protein n=1 Tax=Romanomermis culicivorax TaxID=13658 RepID=A0A915HWP2_ROMCU